MTLATALVLLSPLAPPSQAHSCGVTPSVSVNDSGVGALRLGLTIAQVLARCAVVRDTTLPNWDFVEPERVLFVQLGSDTVQAALDTNGRVVRIYVDGRKLRTIDGLGVGTKLRALAKPGATGAASEATFGVTLREHCGLRFAVAGVQGVEQGAELDDLSLRSLPPGPTVTRVEISGCRS